MGVVRKAIKEMFDKNKWKIVRGDTVYITAGKDKGTTGTVTEVVRDKRVPRIVVEGRNLHKRHVKRTESQPGGTVAVEAPLHYSNVALVDPVSGKPVRVTLRYLEDGTKVRVTKGKGATGSVVPKPDILTQRRKPHPLPGAKDTRQAEVLKQTYTPGEVPTALLQLLPQSHPWVNPAAARARQYCTSAAGGGLQRAAAAQLAAAGGFAPALVRRQRGFAASALLPG